MSKATNNNVFEIYAHEYDLITNAKAREGYHAKEITAILDNLKPGLVLDAGCATGLTSYLTARQGVEVIGLDRSKRMLEVARQKYGNTNLPLSFQYGNFEKLRHKMNDRFDLILCLANSISGVSTMSGLQTALKNFYRVLKPGGTMLIQMLNYAGIEENMLFPIKATENNGIIYERFSERRGRQLFVYVSRLDLNENPSKLEIFRSQMDNFTVDQMEKSIQKNGFTRIRKFSDLYLSSRFNMHSRDLVILGEKPKG